MRVAVFTVRSSGIGIAIALLFATALRSLEASWSLAIANGLTACGLVLIVSVARRLGRFRLESRVPSTPPWLGIWMVGYVTMSIPLSFVLYYAELGFIQRLGLASLFGLVAVATYACGDVVASLDHRARGLGPDVPTPPDRDPADTRAAIDGNP